jgi:hypothetical protein
LTPLEWTCIGPVKRNLQEGEDSIHAHYTSTYYTGQVDEETQVKKMVKQLWELDAIGLGPKTANQKGAGLTPEERKVLASMQFEGGRYQVETPWRHDEPNLPRNLTAVARRQEKMESNLKRKDPEFYLKCDQVIQDQVRKDYLVPLGPVSGASNDGFHIPVFPVRDDNRAATKVRMVLDCASKFDGTSLNSNILPGPKLLNDLVDVILRF